MPKAVKENQGGAAAESTDNSFDFDDFFVYDLYMFIKAYEQKKIVPAIDILNRARCRLREAESGLEFVDVEDENNSVQALRDIVADAEENVSRVRSFFNKLMSVRLMRYRDE